MTANPIPFSLDNPVRFTQPLDSDEARTALRDVAEQRRQAREWKQRAMADAAEKERTYRRARARSWALAPAGSAKEREDWVNDNTADARYDRDVALYLIKAADERLAEVDAERASLHKLCEWSMRMMDVSGREPAATDPIGGRRAA